MSTHPKPQTIESLRRERAQYAEAAKAGDKEASKTFKLLSAEIRMLEDFESAHLDAGEFKRDKEERERAATELAHKRKIGVDARALLDRLLVKATTIAAELSKPGQEYVALNEEYTQAYQMTQELLGHSPDGPDARPNIRVATLHEIDRAKLPTHNFGSDAGALGIVPTVDTAVADLKFVITRALEKLGGSS